nr:probable leucine-rich repeat receptor-like protein kinase At5g49770 [Tanacetum cinerariifolium]
FQLIINCFLVIMVSTFWPTNSRGLNAPPHIIKPGEVLQALRDVWKDTPLKWDDGSDPSIGELKKLTNLVLVGCGFNGPIPNDIGNLERLRYLSLNNNGFTGSIPPSIGNLKSLYCHFGDNQLDGDIPFRLFNSKMTLIHLLFENNRLTGPIPSTLGLVTSLEVV